MQDAEQITDAAFEHEPDIGIRFIGRILGKYTIATPDRRGSDVQLFACCTNALSPFIVALAGPVSGKVGDWVTAHIRDIGLVRGPISHRTDVGFAIEIQATDAERLLLAGKIRWLKNKINRGLKDNRTHRRFHPRDPHTTLVLADGQAVRCFVIDMSSSGAAISADHLPEIGAPLAIGSVVGRVVRHLEAGFAVHFVRDETLEALEDRLIIKLDAYRSAQKQMDSLAAASV